MDQPRLRGKIPEHNTKILHAKYFINNKIWYLDTKRILGRYCLGIEIPEFGIGMILWEQFFAIIL